MSPSSQEHLRRLEEMKAEAEASNSDPAGGSGNAASDGLQAQPAQAGSPSEGLPAGRTVSGGGKGGSPRGRSRTSGARPGANRWLTLLIIGMTLLLTGMLIWIGVGRLLDGASAAVDQGLSGGIQAWWLERNADALEPAGIDATPVDFEIGEGEALPQVAERLAAMGIIQDAALFRMLASSQDLDTQVQAGVHVVRADMSAQEVLDALLVAPGDAVTVTIPEGWRREEVAGLLEQQGLASRDEFLSLTAAFDPALHPQLIGIGLPEDASLEGYLFPDTYDFEPDAGAQVVLARLLDTFAARVGPVLEPAAAADAGSAEGSFSTHERVILASIVEREAVLDSERARIAQVYLNRLSEAPFILNADPTIQYALGFQPEANSWWKRPLYTEDLQIDDPYNSYLRPGLPPSPIASPGLASFKAVVEPEPGPWMYFVANDRACDGSHVFAETLGEHADNIAAYQTGECGR